MAGYNVGSAEVTVVPNAERFNEILGPQILAQADEIGRQVGDRIAEQISARLRESSPDLNIGVDTGKATADVDRFLADTDAKVEAASVESGDKGGSALSKGIQQGFVRNSPMVAAAIAGGLIAGAPAAIAAAGALFVGIAAAAEHSNADLQAAFTQTKTTIEATFTDAAAVTVPMFVSALGRIGSAVQGLAPQLRTAFSGLAAPIDSLTTGLISLANNAMPGIVSAVRAAGPVFQGLSTALSAIGTGLGDFFSIVSQHASAAGTVFSSLGSAVGSLLPILGQLVGAGVELAAQVLPPLASVLHVVADALNFLAPVLPTVAAGFAAFMIVKSLTGPLDTFANKLSGMGSLGSTAGGALSKVGSALPVIGVALAAVSMVMEASTQQIDAWGKGLLAGGTAAAQAAQQMQHVHDVTQAGLGGLHSWGDAWDRVKALTLGTTDAQNQGAAAAKKLYDAMSPLEQKQQDVTKATNDYSLAVQKYGSGSIQAQAAAGALSRANDALTTSQAQVNGAMNSSGGIVAANATRLQGIANAASSANTQISLLTGALNALTGKAVTMDQAQIAVTQAVATATSAVQNQTGALFASNGQLDLNSQKGAAAASALIGLAGAMHQQVGAAEQQGQTTAQVTALTDQLRQKFVATAEQMGANASEANALADKYYGIPTNIHTEVTMSTNAPQVLSQIGSVQAAIDAVTSRRYSINIAVPTVTGGSVAIRQAQGGLVHAYAGGGFESMAAGTAQIVPPQTLRVIGDRVTDDEAYIPINNSARSLSILSQTANRMGYQLGAAGGGAKASLSGMRISGTLDLGGGLEARIDGRIDQAITDYANDSRYAGV